MEKYFSILYVVFMLLLFVCLGYEQTNNIKINSYWLEEKKNKKKLCFKYVLEYISFPLIVCKILPLNRTNECNI